MPARRLWPLANSPRSVVAGRGADLADRTWPAHLPPPWPPGLGNRPCRWRWRSCLDAARCGCAGRAARTAGRPAWWGSRRRGRRPASPAAGRTGRARAARKPEMARSLPASLAHLRDRLVDMVAHRSEAVRHRTGRPPGPNRPGPGAGNHKVARPTRQAPHPHRPGRGGVHDPRRTVLWACDRFGRRRPASTGAPPDRDRRTEVRRPNAATQSTTGDQAGLAPWWTAPIGHLAGAGRCAAGAAALPMAPSRSPPEEDHSTP